MKGQVAQAVRKMLDGLLGQLGEVDDNDFQDPGGNLELGENQIGEMDHVERALYTLSMRFTENAHVIETRRQFAGNEETKVAMHTVAHKAIVEADLLRKLMWMYIHARFNNWDKGIGVRKNFSIVELPDNDGGIRVTTHVLGSFGSLGALMEGELPESRFGDPDELEAADFLGRLGRERRRR